MPRKKAQKPNTAQRQLAADWQALKASHAHHLEKGAKAKAASSQAGKQSKMPRLEIPAERDPRMVASFDSGKGNAVKQPEKQYTGDAMVGLATMHKSNTVPIFNAEAAKEVAKMRR